MNPDFGVDNECVSIPCAGLPAFTGYYRSPHGNKCAMSQSPERGFWLSRSTTMLVMNMSIPLRLNPLSGASGFHGAAWRAAFRSWSWSLNPLSGASGFHGTTRASRDRASHRPSQSPERGFRLSRGTTSRVPARCASTSLNPLSGASGFHGTTLRIRHPGLAVRSQSPERGFRLSRGMKNYDHKFLAKLSSQSPERGFRLSRCVPSSVRSNSTCPVSIP